VDETQDAPLQETRQSSPPIQPQVREATPIAQSNDYDTTATTGIPQQAAQDDGSSSADAHALPSADNAPSSPFTSWSPGILTSPRTSGGDQIALDALLSLGNEHATAFIDRNLHRNSVGSSTFPKPQNPAAFSDALTANKDTGHHTPFSSTVPVLPPDTGADVTEESEFALLKHYRYEVAPWVSIS
jgi:hypothetical protein